MDFVSPIREISFAKPNLTIPQMQLSEVCSQSIFRHRCMVKTFTISLVAGASELLSLRIIFEEEAQPMDDSNSSPVHASISRPI